MLFRSSKICVNSIFAALRHLSIFAILLHACELRILHGVYVQNDRFAQRLVKLTRIRSYERMAAARLMQLTACRQHAPVINTHVCALLCTRVAGGASVSLRSF